MRAKCIFTFFAIFSILQLNAQIKVITDGKIGVGSVTTPTSQVELGDYQWLRLNAPNASSGLLFYETGTSTATDIQYGAKIFYEGNYDRFSIVTRQNNVNNYGICIQRTYGRVGIGMTSPSYSLDVNGSVRASGVFVSSDLRLKTDITDLQTSQIGNLMYLQAKAYKLQVREPENFRTPEQISLGDTLIVKNRVDDPRNKTSVGYIAQDFMKLYPDLVSEDEQGYLSIDYLGLIPILVESIKQQNSQIDELKKKIAILETKMKTRN